MPQIPASILQDIFLVLFLVFLEGILSIDNAVVLAVMVRHLPKKEQQRALTYGLVGAVFFRLSALALATTLMHMTWVKFVGSAYLIFIGAKHLISGEDAADDPNPKKRVGFWRTVVMIELMDIVFAVDSILAAVALSQRLWIIFTGGMIGVILIRFAAGQFARLLTVFPSFETTAYLLVLVIGVKLGVEALHLPGVEFTSAKSPAFWIFWATMAVSVLYGFRRR